jgi:hypothetical protein
VSEKIYARVDHIDGTHSEVDEIYPGYIERTSFAAIVRANRTVKVEKEEGGTITYSTDPEVLR